MLSITEKIKGGIFSSLLVSAVASLATLPLLLFYFNHFSLISPISNLIMEPLVCLWSLPLGILALPFIVLFPPVADLLISAGSIGLQLTQYLSLQTAQFSPIQIWNSTPSLLLISVYYVSLTGLLSFSRRALRIGSGIMLLLAIAFVVYPPQQLLPERQNRITVIDVGQGSSVLIEFKNGQKILADCGGSSFSKKSIGEMVVAPLLWRKGINKIDTIFISHGDSDHFNGVPAIVKHFKVKKLIVPTRNSRDQNFNKLLDEMAASGIEIVTMKSGHRYHYGENKIICIRNFSEYKQATRSVEENRGLVLKVEYKDFSLLLPGDIDNIAELQMLDDDIQSDLLLASHHGSKSSSSKDFLLAVSPEFMIVSAGISRKKFPHPSVIERAKKLNIPLLSTAKNGTLDIITNDGQYKIRGLKERNSNPLEKRTRICLSCEKTKD